MIKKTTVITLSLCALAMPSASQSAELVGSLNGKFAVNSHGAATYSMGIAVPPGINGMAPTLSLAYSSQNHDDQLGLGWTIGGLQAISRCGQSRDIEGDSFAPGINYNYNDRYCLSGQRLIADAGADGHHRTTYVTQIDSWVRVESLGACGNGPCAFKVTDAQGMVYEFASSTDPTAFNALGRNEIVSFPLTKATDRHGNAIVYSYFAQSSTGELHLKNITYNDAGNQQRQVAFSYEGRPDTIQGYMDGQLYSANQRLKTITTTVGASVVQQYHLQYDTSPTTGHSRLVSVQRCGDNGDCLPATQFDYQNSGALTLDRTSIDSTSRWEDAGSENAVSFLSIDGNGDGKTDLLTITDEPSQGNRATLWNSTGLNFEKFTPQSSSVGGWNKTNGPYQRRFLQMDHDRDGLTDIIEIYKNGDGTNAKVWRNTGNHFESGSSTSIGGWSDVGSGKQRRYLVLDANNDGWTDIVEIYQESDSNNAYTKNWLNKQGQGFIGGEGSYYIGGWSDIGSANQRRYLTLDANADGMTDIIEIYESSNQTRVSTWVNTGGGFTLEGNNAMGDWVDVTAVNAHRFFPMDVNGDGLQDVVKIFQKGSNETGAITYWNTGSGTFTLGVTSGIGGWKNTNSSEPYGHRYLPMDVNGDGKTDLVKLYDIGLIETRAELWFGSQHGFTQGANYHIGGWSNTNAADTRRYLPMDMDGDGRAEIIELFKSGNNTGAATWKFNIRGDQDLLVSVTDGLGEQTTIEYRSLTDSAVYTQDKTVTDEENNSQWINATLPMQVVQQHAIKRNNSADCSTLDTLNDNSSDTTDTGCYRFNYHYEEAVIDRDRGWQGFKRMVVTDEQHNTQTTQTYFMTYPLTGRLAKKTIEEADTHSLMGIEQHIYHSCQKGTGEHQGHCEQLPDKAYRVFLDDQITKHYTLGTHNYSLMTRYGYASPHLTNGQPITVVYDGDKPFIAGDGAFSTCYQFNSAPDDKWWQRSFPTYIKQTAWTAGNCFTASSNWNPATDLSWQHFTYDGVMNQTIKRVYLDKMSSASSSGLWLTTNSTYDTYGNLTTQTQATGLVNEFHYDNSHTFVTSQTSTGAGLTLTSTFAYDLGHGQLTLETTPQGHQSQSILDAVGRVVEIKQTGPAGTMLSMATITYQHSTSQPGKMAVLTRHRKQWDENNPSTWPVSTQLFDGMGTQFEAYKPGWHGQHVIVGDNTYNHKGQVNKAYLAYLGTSTNDRGAYQQYSYDRHGRLQKIESSLDGQVTQYDYSLHDDRSITKLQNSPEANDNVLVSYVTQHNTRGKVVSQAGPSGAVTRYEFDALNRLTAITDPLGQVRRLTYNSLGQKLSDNTAETGTLYYEYDLHGRLLKQTDGAGRVVTRTYDERSRIVNQTAVYNGQTTQSTYIYDQQFGRLEESLVTINDQKVVNNTYRYNLKGLKTQQHYLIDLNGSGEIEDAQDIHVLAWTYDAMDQVKTQSYPDGSTLTFKHEQGENNLLTGLDYRYLVGNTPTTIPLARYQDFHVNGRATNITYGNGVTQTHSFDAHGRQLSSKTTPLNADKTLERGYVWNRANKLTQVTDHNQPALSQAFTYDIDGHLSQANGGYGSLNFTDDLAGNRTQMNGDSYTYHPSKKHQLWKVTGSDGTVTERIYDAAGYLTEKIKGTEHLHYQWDGNGNLIAVTRGVANTPVSNFAYDESNNRVLKHDYDDSGMPIRSTYYLPGLYEVVVNHSTGVKSYTNYLGVAAKTETVNYTGGVVLNTVEDRIMLNTGMAFASVMPTSFAQLDQWFSGIGLILAHNDLGARIIANSLWVVCILTLVLYLAIVMLGSAKVDSKVGRLRHQWLMCLVALGWLSRARARRWDTPLPPVWFTEPGAYRLCVVGIMCLCTVSNLVTPAYAALTPGANGAGVPEVGQFQYFHRDQVTSTSMVTDASGTAISRVEYTPFGKVVDAHSWGEDNYRAKFGGKEHDSGIGLSYFGHRYYDAEIGRFISPDPAAQYHSPYLYGHDDPLTMMDPNGEFAFLACLIIGIVATIGAYSAGVAVSGSFNPGDWSGKAWGAAAVGFALGVATGGAGAYATSTGGIISAIAAGAAIGAVSGGLDGINIATWKGQSGGDFAKTVFIGAGTGAALGAAGGGISKVFRTSASARVAPAADDEPVLLHRGLTKIKNEGDFRRLNPRASDKEVDIEKVRRPWRYANAEKGTAEPDGVLMDRGLLHGSVHSDPALHSQNNTWSTFTSWSTDIDVARGFATAKNANSGIVLSKWIPRSQIARSVPSSGNYSTEMEMLVTGRVKGATVTHVTPINPLVPPAH